MPYPATCPAFANPAWAGDENAPAEGAGIDLLIADISRSRTNTGALVCEVNAQPHLGRIFAGTLYRDILQTLVAENGRIPIAVVLGGREADDLAAAVTDGLCAAGKNAGWAGRSGLWIGGEQVARAPPTAYAAGRAPTLHALPDSAIFSRRFCRPAAVRCWSRAELLGPKPRVRSSRPSD